MQRALAPLVLAAACASLPLHAFGQDHLEARATRQAPSTRLDEPAPSQSDEPAPPAGSPRLTRSAWSDIWQRISVGTMWYLSYGHGETEGKRTNQTRIGRGYLTFTFKPVKWFEPRITLDTHQDETGDWKARLKYLYAKFKLPVETAVITEPNIELGLVHTPWFDFEEHVNNYRMEGTMFIERNGILNSADAGFTIGGLLGRKLPQWYREEVSPKYPGQYGSFALGVYNGGGYHASEENNDKVFESRLTVRPLGLILPGLQLSYLLIYGKGNTIYTPDWHLHDVWLGYEHKYFVFIGQYAIGKGNQKGSQVDADNRALDHEGFSFFGEIKIPRLRSTLIGRFDYFDWDTDGGEPATSRLIAGYAFHFLPHNFVLLSLDRVSFDDPDRVTDWQVKVTLQVHYP